MITMRSLLEMPSLQDDVFPSLNVNNYWSGKVGSASNSVYKEMVFDPSDVVTMIKGRHVLHFGGEFLINRADSTAWGNEQSRQLQLFRQLHVAIRQLHRGHERRRLRRLPARPCQQLECQQYP